MQRDGAGAVDAVKRDVGLIGVNGVWAIFYRRFDLGFLSADVGNSIDIFS
jgi:hypothetical protein